jgi:hypothetical protein
MDEVTIQVNTVKTGLPALWAIRVHEAVAEDPPRNNVRVEQQIVPGELLWQQPDFAPNWKEDCDVYLQKRWGHLLNTFERPQRPIELNDPQDHLHQGDTKLD